MTETAPPRGSAYDPNAVAQAASAFHFRPAPLDPAALPNPETFFQFVDRGWRPIVGGACGLAIAYSVIFDERPNQEKLWVAAAVAMGLAGARTVERNRIGAPLPPQGAAG